MINVVEFKNSYDSGVNWKPQTGRENSLTKSYLAYVSGQYSFTRLWNPGLDPSWEGVIFPQAI